LRSKNDGEISQKTERLLVDPPLLLNAKKLARSHPPPKAERWIRLSYSRFKAKI